MPNNRIVYQNWIAEIGHDPQEPLDRYYTGLAHSEFPNDPFERADCYRNLPDSGPETRDRDEIGDIVRQALDMLKVEEKELIVRFYFMGESYLDISEKSGRSVYKLAALHKRAMRRLRSRLAPFVKRRFQIETGSAPNCPLCDSPHLTEINRLIKGRDRTETWRPVIEKLRQEYGIKISSPQLLIGHEKYH